MSELLNSLNAPETPSKSWADEVAAAEVPDTPASAEPVSEPVTEAPQDAAPETVSADAEVAEETDRRVPLKALQEERQKRAEYERRLQDYERQMAEMANWAAQMQQQQMPPQPEFQPPDPETDPIAALKYTNQQLQAMQEQAAQQQYTQQLASVAYQAATAAAQQIPDYRDAYQYAMRSRAQELAAIGTHPGDIPQIIAQEEMIFIDRAVRNGKNPAAAIYEFAKARGFQGSTAAQPAAAAPDPALQQAKQAVAASASSGGTSSARGQMSVADVAALKGADFDKGWNKLFGGNKSSMFRE